MAGTMVFDEHLFTVFYPQATASPHHGTVPSALLKTFPRAKSASVVNFLSLVSSSVVLSSRSTSLLK